MNGCEEKYKGKEKEEEEKEKKKKKKMNMMMIISMLFLKKVGNECYVSKGKSR